MRFIRVWLAILALGGGQFVNPPSNTYATNFAATENPVSEGGRWVTGLQTGLDWKDPQTSTNLYFGPQNKVTSHFDDAFSMLRGTWGATQTIDCIVKVSNTNSTAFEEMEEWVRTSIGPHSIKGYEVNVRNMGAGGNQYIGIVRWNGALDDFTQLGVNCDGTNTYSSGIANGDHFKVTIDSTETITAYVNNVQQCQRQDTSHTYTSGNPGLGHWWNVNGAVGTSGSDFGFTSCTFTAS